MRGCIFCDEPATTREHVLPSWLLAEVAHRAKPAQVTLALGAHPGASWVERGANRGLKVKYLCATCNGSRMSQLEQSARTYIKPMMADVAVPLDREAQEIVSTWVVKTVMVYECLLPKKDWFYTDAERRTFGATQELPHYTAIWLGRCRQAGWSRTEGRRIRFGPRWPFATGMVNTFSMNHFLFQILTVRMKPGLEHRGVMRWQAINAHDPWAHSLFQCWPSRHRVRYWPPRIATAANDAEMRALARRFDAGGRGQ